MKKNLSGRDKLHATIEHLTENQIDQILTYIKSIEKNRTDKYAQDATDDELLTLLSAEVENRRARQVFEWESTRRKAEARSIRLTHII